MFVALEKLQVADSVFVTVDFIKWYLLLHKILNFIHIILKNVLLIQLSFLACKNEWVLIVIAISALGFISHKGWWLKEENLTCWWRRKYHGLFSYKGNISGLVLNFFFFFKIISSGYDTCSFSFLTEFIKQAISIFFWWEGRGFLVLSSFKNYFPKQCYSLGWYWL